MISPWAGWNSRAKLKPQDLFVTPKVNACSSRMVLMIGRGKEAVGTKGMEKAVPGEETGAVLLIEFPNGAMRAPYLPKGEVTR